MIQEKKPAETVVSAGFFWLYSEMCLLVWTRFRAVTLVQDQDMGRVRVHMNGLIRDLRGDKTMARGPVALLLWC